MYLAFNIKAGLVFISLYSAAELHSAWNSQVTILESEERASLLREAPRRAYLGLIILKRPPRPDRHRLACDGLGIREAANELVA